MSEYKCFFAIKLYQKKILREGLDVFIVAQK